jgi:hypothetical protein
MGSKYVLQLENLLVLMVWEVFSKDEVVFARTSPQHKLEIGEKSTYDGIAD